MWIVDEGGLQLVPIVLNSMGVILADRRGDVSTRKRRAYFQWGRAEAEWESTANYLNQFYKLNFGMIGHGCRRLKEGSQPCDSRKNFNLP